MKSLDVKNTSSEEVVSASLRCLRKGGVLAIPTDTVYGLAADARNTAAIDKIFTIKGRSAEKSLPVFVSSFEMLDEAAYVRDERVMNFLRRAWPGKVTAVLPARGWMPLELRAGGLTVGVRMPDYSLTLDIINQFGGPVTGTSANLSGHSAPTKIGDVINEFKHMPFKPDLILDAGDLPSSLPSTVLDATVWPPKILRRGAVSEQDINSMIGI